MSCSQPIMYSICTQLQCFPKNPNFLYLYKNWHNFLQNHFPDFSEGSFGTLCAVVCSCGRQQGFGGNLGAFLSHQAGPSFRKTQKVRIKMCFPKNPNFLYLYKKWHNFLRNHFPEVCESLFGTLCAVVCSCGRQQGVWR